MIDIQTPSPRIVRLEEPHASPPRHSPTLTRAFHPDDPEVRERQRTMDVDLAMQMCRLLFFDPVYVRANAICA